MAQITPAMWRANIDALGQARAERWRDANGITIGDTVEDDDTLMDPEVGSPSGYAPQAPAFGVAGMSPSKLDELFDAQSGRLTQMYDAAAERLRQRYQGPGTSDLLLALGSALLKPTDDGKFSSSLANIPSALLPYLQSKREFGNDMAGLENRLEMAKAQSLGDLQEKYLTARAKPSAADSVSVNPVTGEVFSRRTGFTKPNAAQVNRLLANPQEAPLFDQKFGPGAAQSVITQYGGQ